MKTRDAFALKDFDAQRILQRNFFLSKLKAPMLVDVDEEILDSWFNVAAISHLGTAKMRRRLDKVKRLQTVTAAYAKRLLEHELKIEKFIQDAKTKNRAAILQQKYRAAVESVGRLQKEINKLISDGEKSIPKVFCKELGERIRTAREALNLERKNVAFSLGISLHALGHFERGEREVSPYVIARLSELLGRSPNWLLGFTQ